MVRKNSPAKNIDSEGHQRKTTWEKHQGTHQATIAKTTTPTIPRQVTRELDIKETCPLSGETLTDGSWCQQIAQRCRKVCLNYTDFKKVTWTKELISIQQINSLSFRPSHLQPQVTLEVHILIDTLGKEQLEVCLVIWDMGRASRLWRVMRWQGKRLKYHRHPTAKWWSVLPDCQIQAKQTTIQKK